MPALVLPNTLTMIRSHLSNSTSFSAVLVGGTVIDRLFDATIEAASMPLQDSLIDEPETTEQQERQESQNHAG